MWGPGNALIVLLQQGYDMYHLLKQNQKKILTIFAAGLMVVFIIPPAVSHFSGRRDIVEGRIGDQEVTSRVIANASQEWNLLKGNIFMTSYYGGRQQYIPLAQTLGIEAVQAIDEHRGMYYLLQLEARRMGIQVSADRLESLLEQRIIVLDREHKAVPYGELRDPDLKDAIHGTVANFLLVQNAAERAAGVVKVSQPMRRRALATQWQDLTLQMVEFDAEALAKKAPAPGQEQLQSLFERFADDAPGAYSQENPLGFGYRYPDRIKLQYLKLGWADLRKAVQGSRSEYEWKVEAYKQYQAHPDQFRVPATRPATQATTAPATAPAATETVIQPFEKVFGDIRDNLVDEAAKTLQKKIRADIEGRLQKDFDAYAAANATSKPSQASTKAAGSSLGVPYASFEYLQKLADLIQKQHHVRLSIVDLDQFKGAKELSGLAGIGSTHTMGGEGDNEAGVGTTAFAEYALADAAPLLPNNGKDNPAALPLYKLSLPLTDPQDDTYYFRLTAAQPSHQPENLAQVRQQVERDARLQEGYQQAKAKAQALFEKAKKDGLGTAAKAAGMQVKSVGPISSRPGMPIENLTLPAVAHGQFTQAAFELLTQAAQTKEPHPMAVINLPAAARVAVARLESVKPEWTPETQGIYEMVTGMQLGQEMRQPLIREWFDYDRLVQRLGYVAAPQPS